MGWSAALIRPVARAAMARADDPAPLRRAMRLMSKYLLRGPRNVPAQTITTPTGRALWLGARYADGPVILYFHGGGFVAGSPQTHRKLAARLSVLTGLPVVLPPYRLAPEHRLPAAQHDALAAADWLIGQGVAADRIILGGDSAGGGLALSVLSALCKRDTPPRAAFAFCPFTDVTFAGASVRENARTDHFFPGDRVGDLATRILGDTPPDDPRLSPLFARFPNCPPVLLQASTTEILRDDSARMAEALTAQGAEVTLQLWENAPHVWHLADGWWPEARAALRKAATFLSELD
ncbi:hypothetical protein ACMU_15040 [Actibacterium mucosum KCTC 23349]|uniref:Alpha/beta hydrolase fold-3 domain-containing protein n=2 Tax=Actibacterium TaxID=1433986 RepID=A0A037ZHG7_9RHOB|nr:hypothetical protein ACMU_15040 [Actibacterium mucosum KCTC 23349]